MNKLTLKKALLNKTRCGIQYNGWPCGTCFFNMGGLTNKDWQALLLFRGDYKPTDLDNLPKNISKSLEKILKKTQKS